MQSSKDRNEKHRRNQSSETASKGEGLKNIFKSTKEAAMSSGNDMSPSKNLVPNENDLVMNEKKGIYKIQNLIQSESSPKVISNEKNPYLTKMKPSSIEKSRNFNSPSLGDSNIIKGTNSNESKNLDKPDDGSYEKLINSNYRSMGGPQIVQSKSSINSPYSNISPDEFNLREQYVAKDHQKQVSNLEFNNNSNANNTLSCISIRHIHTPRENFLQQSALDEKNQTLLSRHGISSDENGKLMLNDMIKMDDNIYQSEANKSYNMYTDKIVPIILDDEIDDENPNVLINLDNNNEFENDEMHITEIDADQEFNPNSINPKYYKHSEFTDDQKYQNMIKAGRNTTISYPGFSMMKKHQDSKRFNRFKDKESTDEDLANAPIYTMQDYLIFGQDNIQEGLRLSDYIVGEKQKTKSEKKPDAQTKKPDSSFKIKNPRLENSSSNFQTILRIKKDKPGFRVAQESQVFLKSEEGKTKSSNIHVLKTYSSYQILGKSAEAAGDTSINSAISDLERNNVIYKNKSIYIPKEGIRGGKVTLGKNFFYLLGKKFKKENSITYSDQIKNHCASILQKFWKLWYLKRSNSAIRIQTYFRGHFLRRSWADVLYLYYQFKHKLVSLEMLFRRNNLKFGYERITGKQIKDEKIVKCIIRLQRSLKRNYLITSNPQDQPKSPSAAEAKEKKENLKNLRSKGPKPKGRTIDSADEKISNHDIEEETKPDKKNLRSKPVRPLSKKISDDEKSDIDKKEVFDTADKQNNNQLEEDQKPQQKSSNLRSNKPKSKKIVDSEKEDEVIKSDSDKKNKNEEDVPAPNKSSNLRSKASRPRPKQRDDEPIELEEALENPTSKNNDLNSKDETDPKIQKAENKDNSRDPEVINNKLEEDVPDKKNLNKLRSKASKPKAKQTLEEENINDQPVKEESEHQPIDKGVVKDNVETDPQPQIKKDNLRSKAKPKSKVIDDDKPLVDKDHLEEVRETPKDSEKIDSTAPNPINNEKEKNNDNEDNSPIDSKDIDKPIKEEKGLLEEDRAIAKPSNLRSKASIKPKSKTKIEVEDEKKQEEKISMETQTDASIRENLEIQTERVEIDESEMQTEIKSHIDLEVQTEEKTHEHSEIQTEPVKILSSQTQDCETQIVLETLELQVQTEFEVKIIEPNEERDTQTQDKEFLIAETQTIGDFKELMPSESREMQTYSIELLIDSMPGLEYLVAPRPIDSTEMQTENEIENSAAQTELNTEFRDTQTEEDESKEGKSRNLRSHKSKGGKKEEDPISITQETLFTQESLIKPKQELQSFSEMLNFIMDKKIPEFDIEAQDQESYIIEKPIKIFRLPYTAYKIMKIQNIEDQIPRVKVLAPAINSCYTKATCPQSASLERIALAFKEFSSKMKGSIRTKESFTSVEFTKTSLLDLNIQLTRIKKGLLKLKKPFNKVPLLSIAFSKISSLECSRHNLYASKIQKLLKKNLTESTMNQAKLKSAKVFRKYVNMFCKNKLMKNLRLWKLQEEVAKTQDGLNKKHEEETVKNEKERQEAEELERSKPKIVKVLTYHPVICTKEIKPTLEIPSSKISKLLKQYSENLKQNKKNIKSGLKKLSKSILLQKAQELIECLKKKKLLNDLVVQLTRINLKNFRNRLVSKKLFYWKGINNTMNDLEQKEKDQEAFQQKQKHKAMNFLKHINLKEKFLFINSLKSGISSQSLKFINDVFHKADKSIRVYNLMKWRNINRKTVQANMHFIKESQTDNETNFSAANHFKFSIEHNPRRRLNNVRAAAHQALKPVPKSQTYLQFFCPFVFKKLDPKTLQMKSLFIDKLQEFTMKKKILDKLTSIIEKKESRNSKIEGLNTIHDIVINKKDIEKLSCLSQKMKSISLRKELNSVAETVGKASSINKLSDIVNCNLKAIGLKSLFEHNNTKSVESFKKKLIGVVFKGMETSFINILQETLNKNKNDQPKQKTLYDEEETPMGRRMPKQLKRGARNPYSNKWYERPNHKVNSDDIDDEKQHNLEEELIEETKENLIVKETKKAIKHQETSILNGIAMNLIKKSIAHEAPSQNA